MDKVIKGKLVIGCVIVWMLDYQYYMIISNDFWYMDVDKDILVEEFGVFFECDDDFD